jgi:DNA-binding transcriptional MerR regulator
MADTSQQSYLSIGEVLGLLLEEFPDVTISKIRFLESQGLISPERTASGYRKFYDDDVELLRVILTEQRQNFLPLRVIKDRLENGEIDPTGEHLRSRDGDGAHDQHDDQDGDDPDDEPAEVPSSSVASHPAANGRASAASARSTTGSADADPASPAGEGDESPDPAPGATAGAAQLLPGVVLDRAELCSMVGMTDSELEQLESFGIVGPTDPGSSLPVYDAAAVEIAKPACAFLRLGVDARHLRNFRTAAEREASLYEQLVAPRFRQRNPEARADALAQLRELDGLGGKLRAAMTRRALGHHFR